MDAFTQDHPSGRLLFSVCKYRNEMSQVVIFSFFVFWCKGHTILFDKCLKSYWTWRVDLFSVSASSNLNNKLQFLLKFFVNISVLKSSG